MKPILPLTHKNLKRNVKNNKVEIKTKNKILMLNVKVEL